MSGFHGMNPATVKDTAETLWLANQAATGALAALSAVRARNDAVTGPDADRLRHALGPEIRRTGTSVQVANALYLDLCNQIGVQHTASGGAVTPVRGRALAAPRRLKIAGLGNSFGAGEGVGEGTDAGLAKYFDGQDRRHRSPFAALPQALERLQRANPTVGVDLYFAASSGAVVRDLVCDQTEQHAFGNKRMNPPTWQVNPAQLFQIPVDADAVVVDLGGNDAGFGPIIQAAHSSGFDEELARYQPLLADKGPDGKPYTEADYRKQAAEAEVGLAKTIVARWLQAIDEIRKRAPDAQIVLANYPDALVPSVLARTSWLVNEEDARRIQTELADPLKAALAKVAELAGPGVRLADVSTTLKGHEVYTAQPWINGLDPFLSDRDTLVGRDNKKIEHPDGFDTVRETWAKKEPFHPNDKGYGAMANPIAGALASSLGLTVPAPPPPGTVTAPTSITIVQGFSDLDGDGIRDKNDPSPGKPAFQGLVNCPPQAKPLPPMFPRKDRDH